MKGGYSRVLSVPLRSLECTGCVGTAEGRTCCSVVCRRVRVRCRRQQRVPGGLRADRSRGRVPQRGNRRGHARGERFRGDHLCPAAGLLLLDRQQLRVRQQRRGRRRLLSPPAAVRRHHRCESRFAPPPMSAPGHRRACLPLGGVCKRNTNGPTDYRHADVRAFIRVSSRRRSQAASVRRAATQAVASG